MPSSSEPDKKLEAAEKLIEGGGKDPADVQALRREVNRLNNELRRRQGATQILTDTVAQVLDGVEAPILPGRPKADRKAHEKIALLHLSDWQIGARTEDYDTGVAEQRTELLISKVGKILEDQRAGAAINEIHVCVGGDIVDGSAMRSDHGWEVDSTVLEQALYSAPRMLVRTIGAMAGLIRTVRVWSVRGNHGRSGPRKADPNPKSVNWDTVTSVTAKNMLGSAVDGKRLFFEIEVERFYQVFSVGEARVLLIHGDQFRGSGGFAGIPFYKIASNMAKWANSMPEPWSVLLFGHYHCPAMGMFGKQLWYLNGSMMTSSPYALEELAVASRPAQRLIIFDPARGPVSDHIIWLDQ